MILEPKTQKGIQMIKKHYMLHTKKRAPKKRRPLAGPNHRSVLFKKTEADPGPQSSIAPPVAFFSRGDPEFAISYFLI